MRIKTIYFLIFSIVLSISMLQLNSVLKLCNKQKQTEKLENKPFCNCDEDPNEIDEVILSGNNTCELVLFPEIKKCIYLNINNHLPLISVKIDSPPPNL